MECVYKADFEVECHYSQQWMTLDLALNAKLADKQKPSVLPLHCVITLRSCHAPLHCAKLSC